MAYTWRAFPAAKSTTTDAASAHSPIATAPIVAALIRTFMSMCRARSPAMAARKIGTPPTTMAVR